MSARSSRFSGFGSSRRRGKAAGAVMACAVMLLAGCGGSGGSAAETSKPAPRGDVATATNTVWFQSNGGVNPADRYDADYTQEASGTTELTANLFVKDGLNFTGWATSSAGPVAYTDGADYAFTESASLWAVYGSCSETQPTWVEYRAQRTSEHNAEVTVQVDQQWSGVKWDTFTATTESGQSGSASPNEDGLTTGIVVTDLNKDSEYNFTVTATNAVGCSYTSPSDHTGVWGG